MVGAVGHDEVGKGGRLGEGGRRGLAGILGRHRRDPP